MGEVSTPPTLREGDRLVAVCSDQWGLGVCRDRWSRPHFIPGRVCRNGEPLTYLEPHAELEGWHWTLWVDALGQVYFCPVDASQIRPAEEPEG